MEYKKKVLLDEIMKYISFEKCLLLNEESLNAIINLNYKNINKKLLELTPHFKRNYKLIKKYINTENILVKSNKNER